MGSKDNVKFWTVLIGVMLCVAIAVTVVDLTIKAAILDESNKLRMVIENWDVKHGQRAAESDGERTARDAGFNGAVSPDVLAVSTTGLETGHVPASGNGMVARPARRKPRSKPGTPADNPEVP
jgi:hypothetical protein